MMPALVTPFDESGEIDFEAQAHNVALLESKGVEGFLLCGSTGEGPYIDPGERRQLVEATRELTEDAFLLCGVAAQSVRQAIAQATEAAEGGADAALAMTPTTMARTRPDAVATFYRALETASPLPVLLYSVPAVTAFELSVDDAVSLAARPNIVGMKDSGGQPVRVQQIVGSTSDFRVFAGASSAVALSVAAGGHGAITASANYAPTLVREVVDAARKGIDKAAEAQERLAGLSRLVDTRGVPGVKLAAEIAGLRPGLPRLPLQPLSDDEASTVRRQLEALRGQLLG